MCLLWGILDFVWLPGITPRTNLNWSLKSLNFNCQSDWQMKYYAFSHTSGMNAGHSVSLAWNFDKKIQSVHVVKEVCTESRKNNSARYCEWNDNFYILGRMTVCWLDRRAHYPNRLVIFLQYSVQLLLHGKRRRTFATIQCHVHCSCVIRSSDIVKSGHLQFSLAYGQLLTWSLSSWQNHEQYNPWI